VQVEELQLQGIEPEIKQWELLDQVFTRECRFCCSY